MRLTLMISTYEKPQALRAVLATVLQQTTQPYEVIVCDDGSGSDTAAVINEAAAKGLNIIHEWREHDGYRLARMRNCAFARASGDYIVSIDGDMIIHPKFISDHLSVAKPGFLVRGPRVALNADLTQRILDGEMLWPSMFSRGIKMPWKLFRSRFLSGFNRIGTRYRGVSGSHWAVWLEDAKKINGFNEDFLGWGCEDYDFSARLWHSGVRRIDLRFAALACHLWHPHSSKERADFNEAIYMDTLAKKKTWCERGLNQHA